MFLSKIISGLSSTQTGIDTILSSSFKMYLAGLIGMPAGMYASFLTINLLSKVGVSFNGITLAIATITGEIINTMIVFPIGLNGAVTFHKVFHAIIIDALVFKIIIGTILSFISILIINVLVNKKINSW